MSARKKKLYELTPEHRAQLKPWADRWIANALRTAPMTDADRDAMRVAVNGLHDAAKLERPERIVFCASPIGGAIAASVAAGVWYLRENPAQHQKLFRRKLTEADLQAAIAPAVAHVVRHGLHRVLTLEALPAEMATRPRSATDDATDDATDAATYAATSAATRAATYAATSDATRAATSDATDAATSAATSAATYAATDAATSAATRAATSAATRAATSDATDAATSAATSAATYAATSAATSAATDAATSAATYAATSAATSAATYAATDAATSAATRAATYAATSDATRAATSDATDAATSAATSDATDAATDAATRAATSDATDAATSAATRAATYAATSDATRAATSDATDAATSDDLVRFLVLCCNGWSYMWNGGNQWSAWTSYLSFFRHVAKLDLPEYERFQHFEASTIHGGPRFMHRKFCIAADFPTVVAKDDRNRPHREDGPFIAWRDGWELYAWHGTRVPADWIMHKDKLDPQTALTHENIEARRAAAEIVGWARILEHVSATVVDKDDPEIGTLYVADLPDAPGSKFLEVKCGTGRRFVLPVPGEMKTALQANSWTYDVPQVDVRKLEVRT